MQSPPATRPPARKASPALTITLIAVILSLLLLFITRPARDAVGDVSETTAASEIPGDAAALDPTRVKQPHPAKEATDETPVETVAARNPPPQTPTANSTAEATTAVPAGVALAEDGAPLSKTKRPVATAASVPESEYQRQTRIWWEGIEAGRDSRVSGGGSQSPLTLEQTAREKFPDDQVGQLMWELGYESGYLIAPNRY